MAKNLRVLIVEDSEQDTALLVRALRRGPWEVTHERVDTAAAMSAALDKAGWDLIIADYSMPCFSGPSALALAIERTCDVPFILVSGVVTEETAVHAMKAGADDYFSKGNFARLVPAVERELHQANARREARLVEHQLRKREAHLADALQLARVGTWYLDINMGMAVWSDEACRIIGAAPEQTPPNFEALLDRLYPKDRIALTELLHHPDTKQFSQDLQMIRAGGAAQFVNIRGDIIRDGALMPLEAAGTIQDITERKTVEAEIERMNAQLTGQNHKLMALSEQAHRFVDDVSHEFRTPLAVIKEFGSIITDGLAGPITPEQAQYLGIMDNAVLDLNQMVEDFLDSSKLRAGRLRVDRRPQKIDGIFARIRPGLQKKAASRSITVVERIQPGLPLVFADEEKVRRVIMNLATNAIKFSPEKSYVELWARPAQDGGIEVGVTDRGRGMTPEDVRQLFERFRQLPNSDTPSAKGFGLGLNIARQLVWLNLGNMNVVSELGHGSTFSFTLPAYDPRMILDRFFTRLAECDEVASYLAVISVKPDGESQESVEAQRLFLAATTRPTDVILDMGCEGGNGLLVFGSTQSAQGWVSRLLQVRDRAVADAGTGNNAIRPGYLQIEILGTFDYPNGVSDATACGLKLLSKEPAIA